jgi:hypothetical protein
MPSILGDSIAVAFSGSVLGPVAPCSVHIFEKLIHRRMQTSALSLNFSVGNSGGAFAPLMTGMLAQYVGTFVLHPICIGLFVCMGLHGGGYRSRRRDLSSGSRMIRRFEICFS